MTLPTRLSVPSLSTPGTVRTVTLTERGLECDCPRFDFAPPEDKRCHHTDIYRAVADATRRCAELHGGDGGHICAVCLAAWLAAAARQVRRQQRKGGKR